MATITLRCGDPQCEHSTPQGEWPAQDYAACSAHARETGHPFGGALKDGVLWSSRLKGLKLRLINEGAIARPEADAAQRVGESLVAPMVSDDGEFPDDDGLEGVDDDPVPDPFAQGSAPQPRGRRPAALAGAYRAWMPYPVLPLNEVIGIYYRAYVLRMVPLDENGEPDAAYLTRPVTDYMAEWILGCVQQHQRDHPEQYEMQGLIEEPRMRALDERERALSQREAHVGELWRRTMQTAADLNAQMAAMRPEGAS